MSEDSVENQETSRPAARRVITIVAAVLGLALIAGCGWYFIRYMSGKSEEKTAQAQEEAISKQAAAVADFFTPIRNRLGNLAGDKDIIALFESGNADGLALEAERRTDQFDSVLKLRFLLPGNYELDNDSSTQLGFASLAMLRRAESTGDVINPEAIMPGSDSAHVVFIERVKNAAGEVIGLLHLSLGSSLLEQSLTSIPDVSAYLELQQNAGSKTLVLASRGDAGFKQGAPAIKGIKGTGWNLAYWGELPVTGAAQGGLDMTLVAGVIIVVLLGSVIVLVFSRRKRAVSNAAGQETVVAEPVVYAGAIKAIMDGAHPGMEKLVPNLGSIGSQGGNIQPLSQGLVGDDITMIASAGERKAEAEGEAEAEAEDSDFFDLTGGTATPPSEAVTEPNLKAVETSPGEEGQADPGAEGQIETPGISPVIFRTYDIRGVVGKDLTPEIVNQIGRSIGSEAAYRKQNKVVVGRDGRDSSPELGEALITGLRAAGRDVIDIGMVPTPVLYYATNTLDTTSGVMLTGSHNGPEYNGLKIVLAGETLSENAIRTIYQRIVDDDLETGQGGLVTQDILADYIRRVSEDIPVALGGAFKLVVDCGNGVAGIVAPQLYRALGHDVIELFCDVDGKFPNHHPDPSQPENLQALIDKVREEQADLGFAFDGDADRLGVIDGEGNIIWPDRQLMILARDVLTRNPGAEIIYDVKCSRHLKTIIEAGGGSPLMWKTGHSLIKGKMKEVNAPLAGEMSGHIFFKERWYGFDDALYTGARLLEVLQASKARPAEVFAEIPDAVSTPELRVDLPEDAHQSFMEELKSKITFEGAEVFDIDGYRVEFPDGWGLVRPSNTSPCLILRFEADNQEALARIQSDFHQLLLSVNPDLTLPF